MIKNLNIMKKTLKTMVFALLALGMLACTGNAKKITVEELKEAQAVLRRK